MRTLIVSCATIALVLIMTTVFAPALEWLRKDAIEEMPFYLKYITALTLVMLLVACFSFVSLFTFKFLKRLDAKRYNWSIIIIGSVFVISVPFVRHFIEEVNSYYFIFFTIF